MQVKIPYRPRAQFLEYHANQKRFSASVCHRRAGKTVARINKLVKKAVLNEREWPPPRYGYVAPYFVQAKDIAWPYLKYYTRPLLEHGGKVDESELSVTLPGGQIIRLYGAENAERMRGVYFDGIACDEAQRTPRATLTQIILPCLADYQGWLDISGTPKGWQNLLGEIVRMAQKRPDEWFLQILKASESGIVPAEELERQRALMSANEYAQEYECDFDAAITGAVYGQQIALALAEGRIHANVLHEPAEAVHTAWDVGWKDSTAIWWWQRLRGELRIIDYYENFGLEVKDYCQVIKDRATKYGYTYGTHYVPHDAGAHRLEAAGRSIVDQALGHGVRMFPVKATSQQNSIEAARVTLRSSWFNAERTEWGVECLRQYQFEWDERLQTYKVTPRHDKFSHGADAFEILARVWREPQEIIEPVKPDFTITDRQFDDLLIGGGSQERL